MAPRHPSRPPTLYKRTWPPGTNRSRALSLHRSQNLVWRGVACNAQELQSDPSPKRDNVTRQIRSTRLIPQMSRRRSLRVHILVFLAPAVLIYTLFMIYPLFDSLWLSLNNKAPAGGSEFVGVQNYQTFLSQERWAKPFWNALRNNGLFFVIHMLVQNPI